MRERDWLQEGMLGSYCTQNEAETEFLTSCPNYTNYTFLPHFANWQTIFNLK